MRVAEGSSGAGASSALPSPPPLLISYRQEAGAAMTEGEAAPLQSRLSHDLPEEPQVPDLALHPVQLEASPGRTGSFYGTVTIDDQHLTVRFQDGLLSLEARDPGGCGTAGTDLQSLRDAGLDQLVLVSCEPESRRGSLSSRGEPTSEHHGNVQVYPPVAATAPQRGLEALCTLEENGIVHGQLPNLFIDRNGEVRVNGDSFSRKGLVVVFHCPQPNCLKTFDRKHKLKLHLLTQHTSEEQRPFRCTVEGCSWAFTTSYKLKRHLQSHGNLRPYTCPLEGCGKTFTTVYNLKAHGKTHEMGDTFRCEVCGECFPSLAKLTCHRKTHFEPNKPYACEFPERKLDLE